MRSLQSGNLHNRFYEEKRRTILRRIGERGRYQAHSLNLKWVAKAENDLKAAVLTNTLENVRLALDHVASDRLQDLVDSNFKFYKRITDDKARSSFKGEETGENTFPVADSNSLQE